MTNEVGQQRNENPEQVTAIVQKIVELKLPYAIWFSLDIEGRGGARALTDTDGRLRPNGKAFQQFIEERFSNSGRNPPRDERILGTTRQERIEVLKDIEYAKRDGVSLKLDLCRPQNLASPRPTMVVTHGGGFRRGDKKDLLDDCQELAKLGYVAATVNYRLAPTYPYPAQIDDVQYAVRWLRANAGKYLIDPNNLGSLGGSAGGYLATMLGIRDTRDPSFGLGTYSSKVKVVIDRFGVPMDATDPSVTDPKSKYAELQAEIMKSYLRGYTITPELLREISPITYVTADDAPLLAVHSVNDQLAPIAHSQKIVAALTKVSVSAKLEPFQGQGTAHGLVKADPQEQKRVENLQVAFLATYLPVDQPVRRAQVTPTPTVSRPSFLENLRSRFSESLGRFFGLFSRGR